ncbi:hypothetical protein [Leifsonia sp. EB34]|uniref:hypothetical protein n=1 Tax=Leifsonia sp. EB34 TaxID=3156303 RepID=UPI0035143125
MERERPAPMPFGASGEDAIELSRRWMVFLGAHDVVVARNGERKLCDLYSRRYLAWVTDERGNVDTAAVDRAAAVATSDGRIPLVFIPGGVRPVARERADSLGVALLRYRANDGALDGVNALGRQLRADGLIAG